MSKIVNWILRNKEWLFSGTGIIILTLFITVIKNMTFHIIPRKVEEKLYFGYLPDAWPVSYREGELFVGYCADLMKDINKELDLQLEEAVIRYPNRFKRYGETQNTDGKTKRVPSEQLVVECGPNTITKQRIEDLKEKKGYFSKGFHTTGSKLLVKDVDGIKESLFDKNMPLKDKKISILGHTTANSLIQNIYTAAEVEPIKNRGEIASYIGNPDKAVIIYASDEILLEGLLRKHWSKLSNNGKNEYFTQFFPKCRLSHEEYGIVVYDIDKNIDIYKAINRRLETQDLEQWLNKNLEWQEQGTKIGRKNNTVYSPEESYFCMGKNN